MPSNAHVPLKLTCLCVPFCDSHSSLVPSQNWVLLFHTSATSWNGTIMAALTGSTLRWSIMKTVTMVAAHGLPGTRRERQVSTLRALFQVGGPPGIPRSPAPASPSQGAELKSPRSCYTYSALQQHDGCLSSCSAAQISAGLLFTWAFCIVGADGEEGQFRLLGCPQGLPLPQCSGIATGAGCRRRYAVLGMEPRLASCKVSPFPLLSL